MYNFYHTETHKVKKLEETQFQFFVDDLLYEHQNIHPDFKLVAKNNISDLKYFEIQNRRYLGNKYKLLKFISNIVTERCGIPESFFDIFAGTGVVGSYFNRKETKIISNDLLSSNSVCLKTFIQHKHQITDELVHKIAYLNKLSTEESNYFSINFGNKYFSEYIARKIGIIRDEIDIISKSTEEKEILLCSLIYAVDKVANTVGHYDAYRKTLDLNQKLILSIPKTNYDLNHNNSVFQEDANQIIKNIESDVLYIDPPYNSRQYSDTYHLLENLIEWEKPSVKGIARKMDRSHIKSNYCTNNATMAFEDLIRNSNCNHILLSYNNTGITNVGRSSARIRDKDILRILEHKGSVEVYEQKYKAYTTGKSKNNENFERIFYCKVK